MRTTYIRGDKVRFAIQADHDALRAADPVACHADTCHQQPVLCLLPEDHAHPSGCRRLASPTVLENGQEHGVIGAHASRGGGRVPVGFAFGQAAHDHAGGRPGHEYIQT